MAAPVGYTPDWIELYNAGSQWVDLTGVLLGDSNVDNRFIIGQSSDCATLLPPRGFLVLMGALGEVPEDSALAATVRQGSASQLPACRFDFGLSRTAEEIHLYAGACAVRV
jgi:hypothetical protein